MGASRGAPWHVLKTSEGMSFPRCRASFLDRAGWIAFTAGRCARPTQIYSFLGASTLLVVFLNNASLTVAVLWREREREGEWSEGFEKMQNPTLQSPAGILSAAHLQQQREQHAQQASFWIRTLRRVYSFSRASARFPGRGVLPAALLRSTLNHVQPVRSK